jgi:methylenetetrahydrofolate dehydrogenase (NADP+)/methenyltetrahydrofolate cyclohydrolase/formyltetrahydrofolate synthetase
LQLPLDSTSQINAHVATERISWRKDVDGMTSRNLGLLSSGNLNTGFISCTPNGCLELIKMSGVDIKGTKAVVIGTKQRQFLLSLLNCLQRRSQIA